MSSVRVRRAENSGMEHGMCIFDTLRKANMEPEERSLNGRGGGHHSAILLQHGSSQACHASIALGGERQCWHPDTGGVVKSLSKYLDHV